MQNESIQTSCIAMDLTPPPPPPNPSIPLNVKERELAGTKKMKNVPFLLQKLNYYRSPHLELLSLFVLQETATSRKRINKQKHKEAFEREKRED